MQLKADINQDGKISSLDYWLCQYIDAINATDYEKEIADVNGDGYLDSNDFHLIANHLYGRVVIDEVIY